MALKAWQQICKSVMSMMEAQAIVDTLYFGSFAKASSLRDASAKGFVYCPGPRSTLKLIENDENLAEIGQSLIDEKLQAVSVAKVADATDLSNETVSNIFAGVRDEIVDLVQNRKTNVLLNFGFGSLHLKVGGTIEFKSTEGTATAAFPDFDRIPYSSEFDAETNAKQSSIVASTCKRTEVASRKSLADRSLNFMQQR